MCPPRDEEGDEGGSRLRILDGGREEVRLHVVYRDQGPAQGEGCGLGPGNAHEQRADQTRTGGDGHRVDLLDRMPPPSQSLVHNFVHLPKVGPGRELGHDSTVKGVLILREDRMAEKLALSPQQRRRGLVAARFETEDQSVVHGLVSKRTVTESTAGSALSKAGTPRISIGTRCS